MPDIFDLDQSIRDIEQEVYELGKTYVNSKKRAIEMHRMRVRKLQELLEQQLAAKDKQLQQLKQQLNYHKNQGQLKL